MQKSATVKNIPYPVAVSSGLQPEAEALSQKGSLVPLACPINKSLKYQKEGF